MGDVEAKVLVEKVVLRFIDRYSLQLNYSSTLIIALERITSLLFTSLPSPPRPRPIVPYPTTPRLLPLPHCLHLITLNHFDLCLDLMLKYWHSNGIGGLESLLPSTVLSAANRSRARYQHSSAQVLTVMSVTNAQDSSRQGVFIGTFHTALRL
jgi:hypothetical protein